jgi:predicted nucleic acid-binding protein
VIDRQPFNHYASKLINLIEKKEIKGFVSALTLTNTHYLLKRELNKKIADEFLNDSLKLFSFLDISKKSLQKSIKERFRDFEDDIHYYTSVENDMEYIITRNKKDFRKEKIGILTAEEFLLEMKNAK